MKKRLRQRLYIRTSSADVPHLQVVKLVVVKIESRAHSADASA